jgi:serine/threonine-protein kinase
MPMVWAAGMAAVAAMLAAAAVWMGRPGTQDTTVTSPVMQVTVSLPRGEELAQSGAFALSSDGARIAYVSTRAGQAPRLHVRTMASGAIVDIPGADGASEPFFSPDDQWIGFFADGKLKKALANGGAPQTVCDARSAMGGAWGPDDTIYFAPFNTSGLWSVSSAGGTPKAITSLDRGRGETSHRWPHVLPGGTAILFTIWTGPGWDEHELQVLTLASGERRQITKGATAGQYVASGHIVYSRADVLMAVPFDVSRLQTTAASYELRERVLEEDGSEFAVSATGLLAYVAASPQRLQRQLVWVDGSGQADPIPASPRPYFDPAVSPDGRLAVVSVQGPVQTLWVYDIARRTLTPLTPANIGSSQAPLWTPDGKRVAYRGTRTGFRNLFWRAADGSDDEERLSTNDNLQTPATWTPDGRNLVYIEVAPDTGADIFVLSLDGRTSKPVIRTTVAERNAAISPDGRWLAYVSNESGADEVYVRPFAGAGARLQVSTDGGSEPSWARQGLRLIYRSKDQILAAPIVTQPRLSAEASVVLFRGRFSRTDTGGTPGYGVGPDDRLLLVQPIEPEQPAIVINLVTNWFDEVRRHAPTRP